MGTIQCDNCGEVYEYEDNGTLDVMPDGEMVGGQWRCGDCLTCPTCGRYCGVKCECPDREVCHI